MIKIKEANTICRNIDCARGESNSRKKFYACIACLNKVSWRAYCCCFECYAEYSRQIAESRNTGGTTAVLPERTDMTAGEMERVIKMPEAEAMELTRAELSEYSDELENYGIGKVIEMINDAIDGGTNKSSSDISDGGADSNVEDKPTKKPRKPRTKL